MTLKQLKHHVEIVCNLDFSRTNLGSYSWEYRINRHGAWHDFSTLRENKEAEHAIQLVDHARKWEGNYHSFRIRRNDVTVYRREEDEPICRRCELPASQCPCEPGDFA